jgi:hypothetical protein
MFEVIISDEFGDWFKDLDSQAKKDIFASIETLKNFGPALGRPHVDTLKGSKINNLKELRVRSIGRPFRILFLFDPKKRAFLLVGGNKANDKKFYKKLITKAEFIYSKYKEI